MTGIDNFHAEYSIMRFQSGETIDREARTSVTRKAPSLNAPFINHKKPLVVRDSEEGGKV